MKKGFTLIELLAVVVILGIITSLVVPSVFSVIRKGKENAYNILVDSIEESARLYTTRYREEAESAFDEFNYYVITLNDLKEDDLIENLIDPRTDEQFPLTKTVIVTRETDKTLSICYEDRGCYIPTILENILTEEGNVVTGSNVGLHYDETNNYYYFRGSNPNNWVKFNDYLWRIVKVNSDGSLKLVFEGTRNGDHITENGKIDTIAYDTGNKNNYDQNVSIKTNLQDWYNTNITTQNKETVAITTLCNGSFAYVTTGTNKSNWLNSCSTQTLTSYSVGLLNGSDYLYASLDGNCTTSYKTTGDNGTSCKNSNYLYKKDYSYFVMEGVPSTNNVWDVKNTGSLGVPVTASTIEGVRPSITLINGVLVDRGNGTFDNPYEIKTIVNADRDKPEITILGESSVVLYVGVSYTDAGATALDAIDGDLTENIIALSNLNTSVAGDYTVNYVVSDRSGNKQTATRKITVTVLDLYNAIKGVNKPSLATGMIPVKWVTDHWVTTTEDDDGWYSYTETDKQWANVIQVSNPSNYTTSGTTVDVVNDVIAMWVWIPRYIYNISTGWHQKMTSTTGGTILVQFSIGTDDTRSGAVTLTNTGAASDSNNKWTSHPAFKFGDDQVTGIWVAKFEASNDGSNNVKIIPNANSWRSIAINEIFNKTRSMELNSMYGWGNTGVNVDTHMIKNIELGAVAYLTQSSYGINGNIGINNYYNSGTYRTGCGAAPGSLESTTCNPYNTTGVVASTTGTIYGIYDMSGGAYEYAAGYINNSYADDYGSSLVSANAKYKDVYDVGASDTSSDNYDASINHKGDAVYETSGVNDAVNWYNDYPYTPNMDYPWFKFGGYSLDRSEAGIFGFGRGGGSEKYTGFRPVVLVGTGL